MKQPGTGGSQPGVAAAGTVPERAGEEGLPAPDGTAEDDLLLLGPVRVKSSRSWRESKLTGQSHTVCLEGVGLLEGSPSNST